MNSFSSFLLQVKNPEKYGWEPKWLLSHIIDIYLHLDGEPLAQAVANDERSFKIQTFQASSLLSLYYLPPPWWGIPSSSCGQGREFIQDPDLPGKFFTIILLSTTTLIGSCWLKLWRMMRVHSRSRPSRQVLYYHCTIYPHLDGEPLAQAVANDERSFKIQTFQASSLLSLYYLPPPGWRAIGSSCGQ